MDGRVDVTEIIRAVNNALNGCPVCGNEVIEAPEDCDNGGTCLGGANAGKHCRAENECPGAGVCIGGPKAEYPCAEDAACPSGRCLRCVPQGGDTCAANCTDEIMVTFVLEPGQLKDPTSCEPGTSCAIVHGDILTIALPIPSPAEQTLTFGKERDGLIPVIVKADSVKFPKIPVGNPPIACACVRGVAAKTCGGTVFQTDGSFSPDCTPDFTAGDSVCTGKDNPCAFEHGPGNSATGILGCKGLDGVDFLFMQDGGPLSAGPGTRHAPCISHSECASQSCITGPNPPAKRCGPFPPVITIGGSGGPGSGIILNSTAIGTVQGGCLSRFCTAADPQSQRGMVATIPITTGVAGGVFKNANGMDDTTICNCAGGDPSCSLEGCLGPFEVTGAPLSCAALLGGNVSGAALAGAFTAPDVPVVGDAVVTTTLVAH